MPANGEPSSPKSKIENSFRANMAPPKAQALRNALSVIALPFMLWLSSFSRGCLTELVPHMRRGFNARNFMPLEMVPQVALPAKTWEAAVRHGAVTVEARAVRSFFLLTSALSLLWGIALVNAFPAFAGMGVQLGTFLILDGLGIIGLYMLARYGRDQLRRWIAYQTSFGERPAEHVRAVFQKPQKISPTMWWLLGLMNSPRVAAWFGFLHATAIVVIVDFLTKGRTVVSCLAMPFAMLISIVSGGREFSVAACITLIARMFLWLAASQGSVEPQTRAASGIMDEMIESGLSVTVTLVSAGLFRALLQRLWKTEDEVGRVMLMLLRDIRTPLHGTLGNLSNVAASRPEFSTEGDAEAIQDAIFEGLACAEVICVIVDTMSHIEATKSWQDLKLGGVREDISMRTLARQTQGYLLGTARSRQHSATMRWDHEDFEASEQHSLPILRFTYAKGPIHQITLNLIANACKFTPVAGEVMTTLGFAGTGQEDEDGLERGWFTIEVEDSGPGVPIEERKSIFKPLTRGSAAQGVEGSGLGLAVVADIVQKYGGHVSCNDGQTLSGARFVVDLPCTLLAADIPPSASASAAAKRRRVDEIPSRSEIGRSYPVCEVDVKKLGRMLIIDSALNARILLRMLQSIGIPDNLIDQCASGEAAITKIAHDGEHYDIIFCDLVLPGVDGIELTKYLIRRDQTQERVTQRADYSRLVVIGSSATYSTTVNQEWLRAGASFLLPKPFTPSQLASVVNQIGLSQRTGVAAVGSTPPDHGNYFTVEEQRRAEFMHLTLCAAFIPMAMQFFDAAAFFDPVVAVVAFVMMVAIEFVDRRKRDRNLSTILSFLLLGALVVIAIRHGCRSRATLVLPALIFVWASNHTWLGLISVCTSLLLLQFLRASFPVGAYCAERSMSYFAAQDFLVLFSSAVFVLVALSIEDVALRRRERWIHTLSHDIRSPLGGIFASIHEIADKLGDPSDSASVLNRRDPNLAFQLRSARASAMSLLSLVDSVLSLDRAFNVVKNPEVVEMSDYLSFVEAQIEMRIDDPSRWLFSSSMPSEEGSVTVASPVAIGVRKAALYFVTSKYFNFIAQAHFGGTISITWQVSQRRSREGETRQTWLELISTEYPDCFGPIDERTRAELLQSSVFSLPGGDIGRDLVLLDALPRAVAWELGLARTDQRDVFTGSNLFSRVLQGVLGGVFEFCGNGTAHGHMRSRLEAANEDAEHSAWAMLLRLPVELSEQPGHPADSSASSFDSSKLVVFHVDDNLMQLKLTKSILARIQVKRSEAFRTAEDFRDRLDEFFGSSGASVPPAEAPPNVALVDLHLPEINGPHAWGDFLGERLSWLKFIACTGDTSSSIHRECYDLGFVAVLVKPFSQQELTRALEQAAATTNNQNKE